MAAYTHSWDTGTSIKDEDGDNVIYQQCKHCPCKRVSVELEGKKWTLFYKFGLELFDTIDRPLCFRGTSYINFTQDNNANPNKQG